MATITFPSSALASLTPCVRRYFGFFLFIFSHSGQRSNHVRLLGGDTRSAGHQRLIDQNTRCCCFQTFLTFHSAFALYSTVALTTEWRGVKTDKSRCASILPLIFANFRLNREWRQRKATEEDGNE